MVGTRFILSVKPIFAYLRHKSHKFHFHRIKYRGILKQGYSKKGCFKGYSKTFPYSKGYSKTIMYQPLGAYQISKALGPNGPRDFTNLIWPSGLVHNC